MDSHQSEASSSTPTSSAVFAKGDFTCLRCGTCCQGEGHIWLTYDEIDRIADYLKLTRDDFLEQFTRQVPSLSKTALQDQDDAAMSCIFLTSEGCRIHAVKPKQCATFPMTWTREDALQICRALQQQERERCEGDDS